MIRVTVWNENLPEQNDDEIKKVYPDGIQGCIASFLKTDEELEVRTAALDEPGNGLPEEILENTDVLLWWGHARHGEVPDELVARIYERVLRGMGIIVLHSGHASKIFGRLMGTSCNLRWREGDRERVWTIMPTHPIAKGLPEHFEIKEEEMYGERFDIPQPDGTIFIGWFAGGEVFRSGCVWYRGLGKVFYFQPGHETNPTYYNEYVQQIINNAVHWAKPEMIIDKLDCPHTPSLEERG